MIAVDTNILVRYAVKDDKRQTALATSFIADNECYVLKSVILELVWVLSSSSGYNLTRKVVTERLRHIMPSNHRYGGRGSSCAGHQLV